MLGEKKKEKEKHQSIEINDQENYKDIIWSSLTLETMKHNVIPSTILMVINYSSWDPPWEGWSCTHWAVLCGTNQDQPA